MCSNALDLKGTVVWNQVCPGSQITTSSVIGVNESLNFEIDLPDAKALGQAKAILDDGSSHHGSITRDGSFVMYTTRPLGHS